ncbi:hypothetical protein [Deinococcus fonticola]|uniref:hypothetical protein n=1 Tax=Deinococcus fonticola TaxID=2528713 RepID=UPI001074C5FE|nr:hypothetical protein [Deinococcus fonticola]
MKKLLAAVCLASGLAAAQTSVINIPALPPGVTSPPRPSTPAPSTSTPSAPAVSPTPSTPVTTPAAPTVTTLPTGTTALAVTAALQGPDSVRAGEANTWDFVITNTGTAPLHLENGACDVRFEVLNAAGEVVRPDPKNTLCTMQLVITDVQNGEEATMQKIRWEGKDAQGNPVPAGTYTLRAKFVGGGNFTPPATKQVTVQ